MAPEQTELVQTTKVRKVSGETPTLITSIPKEYTERLKVSNGDVLVWTEITHDGKKGLFARKVE